MGSTQFKFIILSFCVLMFVSRVSSPTPATLKTGGCRLSCSRNQTSPPVRYPAEAVGWQLRCWTNMKETPGENAQISEWTIRLMRVSQVMLAWMSSHAAFQYDQFTHVAPLAPLCQSIPTDGMAAAASAAL